jgi:apoptosis-inducing factor 3
LGVERIVAAVTRLDAVAKQLECSNGAKTRYDTALVATGGRPRRLDVLGGRVRGVFILRHGADLAAILDGAKDRANAVVSAPSSSGWRPPVH